MYAGTRVSWQHTAVLQSISTAVRSLQNLWHLLTKVKYCMCSMKELTCCLMYMQPDKLAILTAVAINAGEPDAATLLSDEPPPGMRPSDKAAAADASAGTDGSSAMGSGSD